MKTCDRELSTENGSSFDEKSGRPIIRRKASDFKGTLSNDLANQLQDYVKKSREEWR